MTISILPGRSSSLEAATRHPGTLKFVDSGFQPLLLVVAGPTASGKSDLALHLARQLGGEIINCDSLQVYRGFDVGTAKLSPEEREHVPHHLLDAVEPDQVYTAGEFSRDARALLPVISGRGAVPIVCGGTGFYLRAFLHGLAPAPQRDEGLRAAWKDRAEQRPGVLWRWLRRLDSQTAGRIHPNDVPKTMRALEICVLARRPAGEVFAAGREALEGFRVVQFGLNPPREELYQRVNARAARMFAGGLLEEVERLLAAGVPRTAKAFGSLGYKEALAVKDGRLTVEEAVEQTALQTRHYVKRQLTWFRKEPNLRWLNGFGQEVGIQAECLGHILKH